MSLTPVESWQKLLAHLLGHHYGLSLDDTPLHDPKVVQEHIEAGISPMNAINFLVERYDLVRIDRHGFSWQEQVPYLTDHDIARARRALRLG